MFNCKELDEILVNTDGVTVEAYQDGKLHSVVDLNAEDAANMFAGLWTRKARGESGLRLRTSYDYKLGCHVISSASYGSGFKEKFALRY